MVLPTFVPGGGGFQKPQSSSLKPPVYIFQDLQQAKTVINEGKNTEAEQRSSIRENCIEEEKV